MSMQARREKAQERLVREEQSERIATMTAAAGALRRKRRWRSGPRNESFTTALCPTTRARLQAAHLALRQGDLGAVVPAWLVVDAALNALLKTPDALVDVVRERMRELADGESEENSDA